MVAYARRMFKGGAIQTTVPLAIGSGDGSFTLATGGSTNWPDGSTGNFVVIVDVGTPEKILCSARSGLVVTVAASGRGYDGTSAASHPAGSAIQVIHCAQDDDEANQVVSAVLGQSGAAKGDILYMLSAAGPNTLQRLGVGSNGSLLSAASGVPAYSAAGSSGQYLTSAGSSVPTWNTLPSSLAATADVLTNQTTTSASYTDLGTAGPAVTVVVNTIALVTIYAESANTTAGSQAFASFAASVGNTVAASDANAVSQYSTVTSSTFIIPGEKTTLLTGLTPGSTTFTMKYRVDANTGAFANRRIIVIPQN